MDALEAPVVAPTTTVCHAPVLGQSQTRRTSLPKAIKCTACLPVQVTYRSMCSTKGQGMR